MKAIIYTRADGGLSVIRPSVAERLPSETDDALAARIAANDVTVVLTDAPSVIRTKLGAALPDTQATPTEFRRAAAIKWGLSFTETAYQIIDESAIPADRAFRNAWKAGAACIDCDMTAATGIARDMLRAERTERFNLLDGQWMRETARGNALGAAEIEAKRETLRNWPQDPRISACITQADLKAIVQTMKGEVA